MPKCRSLVVILLIAGLAVAALPPLALAKDRFTLAISIYAGWMPWYYAKDHGILKKWAERSKIAIDVVEMDYIPSVEAFVAGKVDAAVMTNMEALAMPAKSGLDSTALIVGDYSNGNDALLVRGISDVKGLKGTEVYLVELSVSHYLLARALEVHGVKESELKVVNTSDSDIAPAFIANKSQKAVVTWNPMVMTIEQTPGVSKIFDSSRIPGEILDLLVVNTKVLNDDARFAEALVGAWYEVMSLMSQRGPEADKAMTAMAQRANASLNEYKGQLRTTAMFWTPTAASDYARSAEIKEKMDFVRNFCFKHGLLGEDARSVDVVGISYPDGTIQGDSRNIKLRFDTRFVDKAQAGQPRQN
ncbi:MAG TPA: putative urea ABC transporter substrate-binding protein [Candidatus Tectomicrobia bacterium]